MDIGQMLIPMPAAMASSINAAETAPSATSGVPGKSLFAGLLGGTLPLMEAKAEPIPEAKTTAVGGEALKSADATAQLLAGFVAAAKEQTALASTSEEGHKEEKQPQTDVTMMMPQNVALLGAGMQMILPQQIDGRMPSQSVDKGEMVAGVQPAEQKGNSLMAGIAKMAVSLGPNVAVGKGSEALPADDVPLQSVAKIAVNAVPVDLPQVSQVARAAEVATAAPASIKEQAGKSAELAASAPVDVKGQQLAEAVPSDTAINAVSFLNLVSQQGSTVPEKQNSTQEPAARTAVAAPVTVKVPDQTIAVTKTADLQKTPLQQGDLPAQPVVDQQVVVAEPRPLQVAVVNHPQAAVVMQSAKKVEGHEELPVKQTATATVKTELEGAVSLQKVLATTGAENQMTGEGEKDGNESEVVTNFPLSGHQVAKENGKPEVTAFSQKEPARSELSEHVVHQVKEVFANREIKAGSDQMTLKLSPEHLGDLTLNLKMENQQLKVQIVAENQTVKDALMQHSESLKESLSRQNIKVESFDVMTNGGQKGYEQNDKGWKQLAQQQFASRPAAYGARYVAPEAIAKSLPQYGRSQQYSMVDVHF